jgi:hypothetical protein
VITLFFDALTAVVKNLDRALTAVEGARRPATPPAVDDVRPAGAVPRPGTSGHPHVVESTSELLAMAATEIQNLSRMAFTTPQPNVETFAAELRDRAAQLWAVGD